MGCVYRLLAILYSAFAIPILLTKQYGSSTSLCRYEIQKGSFSSQTKVCFSPVTRSKLTSSTLFHLISAQEGLNISELGESDAQEKVNKFLAGNSFLARVMRAFSLPGSHTHS